MNIFPEILKVSSEFDKMRIDNYLKKIIKNISHVHLEKLIGSGSIRLNGKKVKPQKLICTLDIISLPPKLKKNFIKTEKYNFQDKRDIELVRNSLIKDGEDWMAINKPQGIAVQGGSKIHRHIDGLLKLSFQQYENLHLVHRLDKDTTGTLLIAKNRVSARRLTRAFYENKVKKMYLAIVKGVIKKNKGRISIPIKKKFINGTEKVFPDLENGLEALTFYYKIASREDYSFLALFPVTGRTHQLRVHLSEIGHPIIGDKKYKINNEHNLKNKLQLHCYKLSFPNNKNKMVKIEAEIPNKMIFNLKNLGMSASIKNVGNYFDYNLG